MSRTHGGPDARGALPFDLSVCAHPAGPNAEALRLVQAADPTRYPDAGYTALRARLAAWHGVAAERLLLAASASEFIQRLTAVSARWHPGPVRVPALGYGDYAQAAQAWGRRVHADDELPATLHWQADPGSPDGRSALQASDAAVQALDLAYAPLRLDGGAPSPAEREPYFQLHTPNKALGLCGVRGAYAIAPRRLPVDLVQSLREAEPSWVLGAQGVALLDAWCRDEVQGLLARSLPQLREWREALATGLQARGFVPSAGVTPFVMAQLPPRPLCSDALRAQGVAVRDLASFGRPGHWRLNSGPPEALAALWKGLDS